MNSPVQRPRKVALINRDSKNEAKRTERGMGLRRKLKQGNQRIMEQHANDEDLARRVYEALLSKNNQGPLDTLSGDILVGRFFSRTLSTFFQELIDSPLQHHIGEEEMGDYKTLEMLRRIQRSGITFEQIRDHPGPFLGLLSISNIHQFRDGFLAQHGGQVSSDDEEEAMAEARANEFAQASAQADTEGVNEDRSQNRKETTDGEAPSAQAQAQPRRYDFLMRHRQEEERQNDWRGSVKMEMHYGESGELKPYDLCDFVGKYKHDVEKTLYFDRSKFPAPTSGTKTIPKNDPVFYELKKAIESAAYECESPIMSNGSRSNGNRVFCCNFRDPLVKDSLVNCEKSSRRKSGSTQSQRGGTKSAGEKGQFCSFRIVVSWDDIGYFLVQTAGNPFHKHPPYDVLPKKRNTHRPSNSLIPLPKKVTVSDQESKDEAKRAEDEAKRIERERVLRRKLKLEKQRIVEQHANNEEYLARKVYEVLLSEHNFHPLDILAMDQENCFYRTMATFFLDLIKSPLQHKIGVGPREYKIHEILRILQRSGITFEQIQEHRGPFLGLLILSHIHEFRDAFLNEHGGQVSSDDEEVIQNTDGEKQIAQDAAQARRPLPDDFPLQRRQRLH